MEFVDYWKEKEKYFFKYALRRYWYFYSKNSGEWEDAFSIFRNKLMRDWHIPLQVIARDTWAFQHLNWTYLECIRAYRNRNSLIDGDQGWGTAGDDLEGAGRGVDFPIPEPLVDPDDARKLVAAVDSFLDQCVKQFVVGRHDHMGSYNDVKAAYLLNIVQDLKGNEIHLITGITPPQQVQVKTTIKMCIETKARRAGFGEVIEQIKEI